MIYEKLLKKSEMNDLLLGLKGRSVIEILDIQSELPALLRATHENRHKSNRKIKDIREGLFGAMFYNPSSRARTAVNAAIAKLDGDMFEINVANSQLARGESIQDTCDFYNHMLNGLAIRVSDHAVIQEFDKYSTNPIINLLSDLEHPTQTLADLQTLFDNYGYLRGLKITYCGEFNNTSRSLLLGCLSQGVNVTISCPNEVDSVTYIKALALADENGCSFQVEKDPKKAVEGSDGIYTDVTESIGQGIDDKDELEARIKIFQPYQVNEELRVKANKDCLIMHCGPAKKGREITAETYDVGRETITNQAKNRLDTLVPLLEFTLRK